MPGIAESSPTANRKGDHRDIGPERDQLCRYIRSPLHYVNGYRQSMHETPLS